MKIVLQRVKNASVTVGGEKVSGIEAGLLLLVGVAKGDGEAEAGWLAEKISGLRVFADEEGKMNLSVRDAGGEVLAVSQFTLLADTSKGKRPSFVGAAPPQEAETLFDRFCDLLGEAGVRSVKKGSFGAMMDVALVNDGPVTVVLER
jgi:D-tyrosyl-tRNA(Tyr) deacylase